MKRLLLILILSVLGMTQMLAQEYEYVPFVREGVKWVYYYNNKDNVYADPNLSHGKVFLNLEIKGDTIINGKTYKAMHKYFGDAINEENDTIPIYLREKDKVVYGFIPNKTIYPDCPIGVDGSPLIYDKIDNDEEFILYDFNDPAAYLTDLRGWEDEDDTFSYNTVSIDTIIAGDHLVRQFAIGMHVSPVFSIIEGIGYDSLVPGMPGYTLFPLWKMNAYSAYFALSHVIENGEIIYKAREYEEPQPDEYEYVPFVREGVKWVYFCKNPYWEEQFVDRDYYSFEFKSDVNIGDKYYKPVQLTHYLDNMGISKEVEEFTPVYLREEDKVVYAILPDGIMHPQCPVGMFDYIAYPYDNSPITTTNQEFMLYDFNNPTSLYGNLVEYNGESFETIGGRMSKCYHYTWEYGDNEVIIEGIGYDGEAGMPLFYFEYLITGFQVTYGLSHVVENDEIIYKGRYYNPDIHVGIDEVVVDKTNRPLDPNYYNLTGRSVGKDVPTTPGIYIHHGNKIIIR